MDLDDDDGVIWNGLAMSSISEAQRLLCVAAAALARNAARESASALTATHQLVAQLESNCTERWVKETAQEASLMQELAEHGLGGVLGQELWDDSDDGHTAPEEN
jgi:hypothetical protein